MSIEARIIPESKLFFGGNGSTIDPKVGLMKFGPYNPSTNEIQDHITITAGAICTNSSFEQLKSWLERLSYRIEGASIPDSNVRGIDFPGISKRSPLKFEIVLNEANIEIISRGELNDVLKPVRRKERILKAVRLYEQKFSDLSGVHPPPNIVFLPIPDKLIKQCKDPKMKQDKIIFERRTFDKSKKFSDMPVFDFHNVLKIIAFKYGFMTQLIRPDTLKFGSEQQDPATIAWNFTVANYYKGTGFPWKLADVDEDSCFVGISFYQEVAKDYRAMRTSVAHVYMKTGESQIIRGSPIKWDKSQGLSPKLTIDQASEIMKQIIDLYKRQKRKKPRRVVVHKSSPFSKDEILGFDEVNSDIEIVDYIHINNNPGIRAFPDNYDYPILRGTLIGNKNKWLLYTTGFIPSLGTYPGARVPAPLMLEIHRLDSTIYQVCKDIMALTKLDWNKADFCSREPVTISVSRKVGNTLAEIREHDNLNPPVNYRHYM